MARTTAIPKSAVAIENGTFFVEDEVPTGAIDGSNKTYTLVSAPAPVTSLEVRVQGQTQILTDDYTLSGSTLTMVVAWPTGTKIRVDYHVKP